MPIDGPGKRWAGANAGQHEDTGGVRIGVQLCDAADELRIVGQVKIVAAAFDCRSRDSVAVGAVSLKRAGRVDHDVRLDGRERGLHVLVAVEPGRGHRRRSAEPRGQGAGFAQRATRDHNMQSLRR